MAKTFACSFQDEEQLEKFIIGHELYNHSNLFIHVYSNVPHSENMIDLKFVLRRLLPGRPVLSSSYEWKDRGQEILLTFTLYDDTFVSFENEAGLVPAPKRERVLDEKNSSISCEALFSYTNDAVFSIDLKGRFTAVNPAFLHLFGISEKEIIGQAALKYLKPEDAGYWKIYFSNSIQGNIQNGRLAVLSKTGESIEMELKLIPVMLGGKPAAICGIARNMTEQRQMQEKMVQLAYYDHITGLPNRLKFTKQLEDDMEMAKKDQKKLAVLFIDLDRFKVINDSLGHASGDEILKLLARRIKDAVPPAAYLGRFAGDKFTLIIRDSRDMEEVVRTAGEIMKSLMAPVDFDGQELFITASIGISLYPNEAGDAAALLRNADTAMNQSKNEGGGKITFFSAEMQKQAVERLELESSIRKAVQKEEFFLCYQPLADIRTGLIYGCEALIRWEHPHNGLVPPGEFIPLAEEIGLIDEIGTWVLRTACLQSKKWQQSGLGQLVMSVNVSAVQFLQTHFIERVQEALKESGLEPRYLHLELTESLMLGNIEYSVSIMEKLQEMGVQVSIDDFGTGYSSLSYLKRLPIDTLKIDRSFINNLKDASDIAIVKAIITMGQGMNLRVIAEGVETKEQMDLLKDLNCHFAQGFYIHKPLTIQQFEEDIRKKTSAL